MIKFLLSCWVFFAAANSVKAAADTILWSSQRLQWADFKGKADTATYNKDHFATTLWKLTYFHRLNSSTRQVEVIAYAWFDSRRSWVRPSQRTNVALLLHEQGHFDLAEILARQLKKQVAQTHFRSSRYADSLRMIFNKVFADINDTQLRYDVETNFGEKAAQQRHWQTFIATTLLQLADYADKRVVSKAL